MDSKTFAKKMIDEAEALGEWMQEEVLSQWQPLSREQTIQVLRAQSWREYYLGVPPPARQILTLPDSAVQIKVSLTQQLCEEFLHYQVLADRVEELGGDATLARYEPSESDLEIYRKTFEFTEPWEIAASLQIFGETVLIRTLRRMAEVVDERSGQILRDEVIIHEGSHVRNGRLVLELYAQTPEIQNRIWEIGKAKIEGISRAYGHVRRPLYAV